MGKLILVSFHIKSLHKIIRKKICSPIEVKNRQLTEELPITINYKESLSLLNIQNMQSTISYLSNYPKPRIMTKIKFSEGIRIWIVSNTVHGCINCISFLEGFKHAYLLI